MGWRQMFTKIGCIALAAALLGACGTPESLSYPAGKPLKITSKVWGYYQEYLGVQGGPRKDGAFLVVMHNDVGVGARWSYCPPSADYCTTGGVNVANKMCIEKKLKCVLFAQGSKITLPYEIID